jgi:hypothetical protein
MELEHKRVLLERTQMAALKAEAIRTKTSVNEIVRRAVGSYLFNSAAMDLADISKKEISQLARREELSLVQMRKELLADLHTGLSAFTEMSERHIEKSTQLTKAFVQSLSDALNGEMVSTPQETKSATQSNTDIMLQLERQRQQRLGNKTRPTT